MCCWLSWLPIWGGRCSRRLLARTTYFTFLQPVFFPVWLKPNISKIQQRSRITSGPYNEFSSSFSLSVAKPNENIHRTHAEGETKMNNNRTLKRRGKKKKAQSIRGSSINMFQSWKVLYCINNYQAI